MIDSSINVGWNVKYLTGEINITVNEKVNMSLTIERHHWVHTKTLLTHDLVYFHGKFDSESSENSNAAIDLTINDYKDIWYGFGMDLSGKYKYCENEEETTTEQPQTTLENVEYLTSYIYMHLLQFVCVCMCVAHFFCVFLEFVLGFFFLDITHHKKCEM